MYHIMKLLYNSLIYLGGNDDGGGSNSTGLIVGLTLGLGIPGLIVLIIILYYTKAFKKLKTGWDDCTSGHRHTSQLQSQ